MTEFLWDGFVFICGVAVGCYVMGLLASQK